MRRAKIAVIIDDIGFSRSRAYRFVDLKLPLTFSVLPRVTFTRELSAKLHTAGYEIMLHQPMEPVDRGFNPGPGALYISDRQTEISAAMGQNIDQIQNLTGVNNHMGSKFTADSDKMQQALKVIKSEGLFFVDSMTTHRSAGCRTAQRLGISTIQRNVFLDNRVAIPAILNQLDKLQTLALNHGQALAIGHPFPETAAALDAFVRHRLKPGVEFVPVSNLL